MRRILAITLLIAFGSPLVLPLFAAPLDPQHNLPACCRRNGAHHCNGLMASAGSGPALQSPPCPNYPSPATLVSLNAAALAAPTAFATEIVVTIARPGAIRPRAQITILSSNLLRGPPTLLA
jgi:hypothetical protein